MSKCLSMRRLALVSGAALGLALFAFPASAQYYGAPDEEIIINAPRHHPERSDIGAPIEDVAMSQQVRFDDLDLRTHWGARVLRERIEYAARTMCNRLDTLYPVSTSDSPPCYRAAVDDAMGQAAVAIRNARGDGYDGNAYDDGN
jgi:UrcA family protein